MIINGKQFNKTLKAISCKHNIKNYENNNKMYEIFQTDFNSFFFVIDENFDNNEIFRSLNTFLSSKKEEINIDINSFIELINCKNKVKELIEIIIIATEFSTVTPWSLKTENQKLSKVNLIINESYLDIVKERQIVAQSQTLARKFQDMPSNLMVPGTFCQEIVELFKGIKNIEIKILERKELEDKKMNLLVGVGQSAQREIDQPRMIVISYKNNPSSDELTTFVGKGVCFDTGGLNIKIGNYMRWMKFDMSGAAVAATSLLAIAKNQLKGNFAAVCPLVINFCDTTAQRPDDVIVSYSGKTIEIDNTDAEGRLILADALTYAVKDLKSTRILDIATLTGAMIYGLGDTYTGVWTTNDCMWNKISKAAQEVGELVWRLPFHRDFLEMLKSDVADIANSVSDPRGGSSRAACFLKEFTNNVPYAHFDIAGTAHPKKLGVGIMVNTFYNFAKQINNKENFEVKK